MKKPAKDQSTLYSYVKTVNKNFAITQRKAFGTASKYIDFLIAQDRGQKVTRPTINASK